MSLTHDSTQSMEIARRLPPVDRALLALVPCFKLVQGPFLPLLRLQRMLNFPRTEGVVWYHRSTVERLVAESANLPLNSQKYKKWLEKEHLALVNVSLTWANEDMLNVSLKSCKQYEDWVTSQADARAAEIAFLRRQRLER